MVENWSGDIWEPTDASGDDVANTTANASLLNFAVSCAARSIQGPVVLPFPVALGIAIRVLQTLYYACVVLFGSALNILVIILAVKYKKLRTLSFTVSLQIAALDLLLVIVNLVPLINSIANRWVFGEYLCVFQGLYIHYTLRVRALLMFAFVIDRFLSIFWTFGYQKYKFKVIVTLCLASWLISLSIIVYAVFDCFTFREDSWACSITNDCNRDCTYIGAMSLFILRIP